MSVIYENVQNKSNYLRFIKQETMSFADIQIWISNAFKDRRSVNNNQSNYK